MTKILPSSIGSCIIVALKKYFLGYFEGFRKIFQDLNQIGSIPASFIERQNTH